MLKNTNKRKKQRSSFRLSAARLAAIQALYEMDISTKKPDIILQTFENKHWRAMTLRDPDNKPGDGGKARLPNPDINYLKEIVIGVDNQTKKYIEKIASVLDKDWTVERLDILMRALLKSATFEFVEKKEVPIVILLSEYSDLAHTFFDDKEAKFACSIINQLAKKLRADT